LPKYVSFATCVAILSIAYPALFPPETKARESCKPAVVGTGIVASVRDGRTVLLTDGREVRLAAIEVVDSSRDALRSLVDGRELPLMRLGSDHDRYGRVVAFVGDAQSRARHGSRQESATTLAPISCNVQNGLRVLLSAVSGQTPISPLCGRNISTGLQPRGANLH